jgi:outer membrane lipoprotein SlyB
MTNHSPRKSLKALSQPTSLPNLEEQDKSIIDTCSSSIAAASSGAAVGGVAGTALAGPLGGIIGSGVAAVGAALGVVLWTNAHPSQATSIKPNPERPD